MFIEASPLAGLGVASTSFVLWTAWGWSFESSPRLKLKLMQWLSPLVSFAWCSADIRLQSSSHPRRCTLVAHDIEHTRVSECLYFLLSFPTNLCSCPHLRCNLMVAFLVLERTFFFFFFRRWYMISTRTSPQTLPTPQGKRRSAHTYVRTYIKHAAQPNVLALPRTHSLNFLFSNSLSCAYRISHAENNVRLSGSSTMLTTLTTGHGKTCGGIRDSFVRPFWATVPASDLSELTFGLIAPSYAWDFFFNGKITHSRTGTREVRNLPCGIGGTLLFDLFGLFDSACRKSQDAKVG